MKLRWWIVGTIAVVAGGIFVMKHIVDNSEKHIRIAGTTEDRRGSSVDADESEFEGTDFLI